MCTKSLCKKLCNWLPRLIVAFILLQSVPGKLMGAEMPKMLFTDLNILGTGANGAVIVGILELIAGIGILICPVSRCAASLSAVLMFGAMYFHATTLGWGAMAWMALVAFILSVWVAVKPCCKSSCGTKDGSCSTEDKSCSTGSCS